MWQQLHRKIVSGALDADASPSASRTAAPDSDFPITSFVAQTAGDQKLNAGLGESKTSASVPSKLHTTPDSEQKITNWAGKSDKKPVECGFESSKETASGVAAFQGLATVDASENSALEAALRRMRQ